MSLLRQPLLLLARSEKVKKLVSTMPVSAGIVNSYVPGETTEAAVDATAGLVDDGLHVTLDFLGEDTLDVGAGRRHRGGVPRRPPASSRRAASPATPRSR